MSRIHLTGWVEKENRGAWLFRLGFVNGKPYVDGYTAWLPKARCEVDRRVGNLIHVWVPVWFHVKHGRPRRHAGDVENDNG